MTIRNEIRIGGRESPRVRFYSPLTDLLGLRLLKTNVGGVHFGTEDILFSLVATNGKPASAGNGTHGNKIEAATLSGSSAQ